MKHILLVVPIMIASILLSGCTEKGAKEILQGHSFYYTEACEESTYFMNTFQDASIIEEAFKNETSQGTISVPIKYDKENIIVRDGEKVFPCKIVEDEKFISIQCQYEEERDVHIGWKTLELAELNRPECPKSECSEKNQNQTAPFDVHVPESTRPKL